MAYDPATSRLVLYGGEGQQNPALTDTWTWDGTTWAEQSPVTALPKPIRPPWTTTRVGPVVLLFPNGATLPGKVPHMWAYRVVGDGHWLVAGDGEVFSFGAPIYSSMANAHLNQPLVGIDAGPGGDGYYLVGKDGGVFAFGRGVRPRCVGAPGSPTPSSAGRRPLPVATRWCDWRGLRSGPLLRLIGNPHLNQPIVGMAAPDGGGYFLAGKDGGVFAFGPGANFLGSLAGRQLASRSSAWPSTRHGRLLVGGRRWRGVQFGAPSYGSMGNAHLNQPVAGMAAAPDGNGYWLVGKDGGVFALGRLQPSTALWATPSRPARRRHLRSVAHWTPSPQPGSLDPCGDQRSTQRNADRL